MKSMNVIFTNPYEIEMQQHDVGKLGTNEVFCQTEKSLISTGTETLCLRGEFDKGTGWANWVEFPFQPGYSVGARVIAVGSEVKAIKEGDLVSSSTPHHQYFIANQSSLYVVPDGIDAEEATWKALACTTQLGVRRAELELGENVGVIGMGLLGQLVIQYLRASGARRIVAIDPVQKRLNAAARNGATHTLAMNAKAAREEVEELTKGRMLDAVFDITGHPAVLAPATLLCRRLGRVVLLGDATMPSKQILGPRVVADSVSILGIHGNMVPKEWSEFHPWTKKEMTDLFYDYVLQNKIDVSNLVTHRISPKEAPETYRWLLKDRSEAIAVMIDWSMT